MYLNLQEFGQGIFNQSVFSAHDFAAFRATETLSLENLVDYCIQHSVFENYRDTGGISFPFKSSSSIQTLISYNFVTA